MTIQLDHILVPSRDMNASAKLLARYWEFDLKEVSLLS